MADVKQDYDVAIPLSSRSKTRVKIVSVRDAELPGVEVSEARAGRPPTSIGERQCVFVLDLIFELMETGQPVNYTGKLPGVSKRSKSRLVKMLVDTGYLVYGPMHHVDAGPRLKKAVQRFKPWEALI